MLGTVDDGAANALVEVLTKLRSERQDRQQRRHGQRRRRLRHRAFDRGARGAQDAGFKLVYDKTYPIGTQDMSPIINEAKARNPDTFIAFSYPPDTFGHHRTGALAGFNPKVFYTGVGTAFPLFKRQFGKNAEGVMGIGGSNGDSPAFKDYLKRHKASPRTAPSPTAGPAR